MQGQAEQVEVVDREGQVETEVPVAPLPLLAAKITMPPRQQQCASIYRLDCLVRLGTREILPQEAMADRGPARICPIIERQRATAAGCTGKCGPARYRRKSRSCRRLFGRYTFGSRY